MLGGGAGGSITQHNLSEEAFPWERGQVVGILQSQEAYHFIFINSSESQQV